MNKLRLDARKMHPYGEPGRPHDFYSFDEHREYVARKATGLRTAQTHDDAIREYQFVFDARGKHVAMAVLCSGKHDIYYDGMLIDEAGSSAAHESEEFYCDDFVVTYEAIYI